MVRTCQNISLLNGTLISLLLLATLVLGGCPLSTSDPCELDRYQCDDQEDTWPAEPICDLSGTLELEMGEGHRAFAYLKADLLPALTDGAQGGSHMFLGIRVLNPALDLYEKLLVEFNVFQLEAADSADCDSDYYCEDCEYAPETTVGGSAKCRLSIGWRKLALGGALPLRSLEDGTVEEFGFMVFMPPASYVSELDMVELRLKVVDPCGREGVVNHIVTHEG